MGSICASSFGEHVTSARAASVERASVVLGVTDVLVQREGRHRSCGRRTRLLCATPPRDPAESLDPPPQRIDLATVGCQCPAQATHLPQGQNTCQKGRDTDGEHEDRPQRQGPVFTKLLHTPRDAEHGKDRDGRPEPNEHRAAMTRPARSNPRPRAVHRYIDRARLGALGRCPLSTSLLIECRQGSDRRRRHRSATRQTRFLDEDLDGVPRHELQSTSELMSERLRLAGSDVEHGLAVGHWLRLVDEGGSGDDLDVVEVSDEVPPLDDFSQRHDRHTPDHRSSPNLDWCTSPHTRAEYARQAGQFPTGARHPPWLDYRFVTTDPVLDPQAAPKVGPAISVIIATYLGAERIERALDSLAAQSLDSEQFEAVIVVNGDDDETLGTVLRWRRANPGPQIRTIRTRTAGASHARNLGIGAARGTYCTFLDDDDWLSSTFLADLLAAAEPDVVVVGRINDVVGPVDAVPNPRNYFTHQAVRWAGTTVPFSVAPTAAAANAAKLVATRHAAEVGYDGALRSGEDVVFWCDLMTRQDLRFRFVEVQAHAVYYRWSRDESISRRRSSFQFSVVERLDVIERVLGLDDRGRQNSAALTSIARAQAMRINAYLHERPDEREHVLSEIRSRAITAFPYGTVNRGLARELVIAYAFPPTNDTSGIVMARRIRKRGEAVDVIASGLKKVRTADPTTTLIAGEHVARRIVIPERSTFGHWPLIEAFCTTGYAEIQLLETPYDSVYSRSMWPAAHVLAALYKIRHPDVHWRAEFSDPLLYDARGERRDTTVDPDSELILEFRQALAERSIEPPEDDNLFAWIELLVYTLADEILFTNTNQLEYMLGYHEGNDEQSIRERAVIEPHPTLPRRYYDLVESDYSFDPAKINIGYFGVFYKVRGVGDILEALATLPVETRSRFAVHIFTDKPKATARTVAENRMSDIVHVRPYVTYLEFLNLTTKLDWLLVCDARTRESHGSNPYLPSKLSDYRGAGTPIWAIVEESSILSATDVHAKSVLGDVDGAAHVLDNMLRVHAQQDAFTPS